MCRFPHHKNPRQTRDFWQRNHKPTTRQPSPHPRTIWNTFFHLQSLHVMFVRFAPPPPCRTPHSGSQPDFFLSTEDQAWCRAYVGVFGPQSPPPASCFHPPCSETNPMHSFPVFRPKILTFWSFFDRWCIWSINFTNEILCWGWLGR